MKIKSILVASLLFAKLSSVGQDTMYFRSDTLNYIKAVKGFLVHIKLDLDTSEWKLQESNIAHQLSVRDKDSVFYTFTIANYGVFGCNDKDKGKGKEKGKDFVSMYLECGLNEKLQDDDSSSSFEIYIDKSKGVVVQKLTDITTASVVSYLVDIQGTGHFLVITCFSTNVIDNRILNAILTREVSVRKDKINPPNRGR